MIIVIFFALTLICTGGSGVRAQSGAAVGVINVAPTYRYIDFYVVDGFYYLKVVPYDANGYRDIILVHINVTNGNGYLISEFEFRQYDENGSVVNEFIDDNGGWLRKDMCKIEYTNNTESGMNVCSFNLTFILEPFEGKTIEILTFDKHNLSCHYIGPFPLKPPPAFLKYVIPASLIASMSATFIAVWRRWRSNMIAKNYERLRW